MDAFNQMVHVFDNTTDPPTQKESIKLREQPGWVTFSLDGKYAYPSTGEVIDTKTKKIVAALTDETGREVHSEKMVEVHFQDGKPVANGDQFGVGRVRRPKRLLARSEVLACGISPAAIVAARMRWFTPPSCLPLPGREGVDGTTSRKQTEAVLRLDWTTC